LTFGYSEVADDSNPISSILKNSNPQRKYKTIILSPDGIFQGMKIRESEFAVVDGGTF